MGYDDVLRALGDEVQRQIAELKAAAARDGARIVDEARADAARTSDEARARAAAEREARAARLRDRARLDEERVVLVEKRRLLDEIVAEARARLPRAMDEALLDRLVDEVAELAGEARTIELIVDGGWEERARRALGRHAAVAARATVRAGEEARGGVALLLDDRVLLDDTLAARLEALWPDIEPRVAAALFGDDDGTL